MKFTKTGYPNKLKSPILVLATTKKKEDYCALLFNQKLKGRKMDPYIF